MQDKLNNGLKAYLRWALVIGWKWHQDIDAPFCCVVFAFVFFQVGMFKHIQQL